MPEENRMKVAVHEPNGEVVYLIVPCDSYEVDPDTKILTLLDDKQDAVAIFKSWEYCVGAEPL